MNAMKEFESHPAAKLFPMMDGAEMQELIEDIKKNGLLQPIILHDGMILDGRNRYFACQQSGRSPRFEQWQPNGLSPTEWVLSVNLKRRQLTPSQRAVVATKSLPMLEQEAKERQSKNAIAKNTGDPNREIIPDSEKGKSTEKAAALVGVNPRYVSDAKKIQQEAPEIFKQVESGEMTIPEAKREMDKNRPEKEPETSETEQRTEANPKRTTYRPSDGMMFAKMAIAQLERIHPRDTQRTEAFSYVTAWVEAKQKQNSAK